MKYSQMKRFLMEHKDIGSCEMYKTSKNMRLQIN